MKTMNTLSNKYKFNLQLEENELASLYFAIGTAMRLVAQRKEDGVSLDNDPSHLTAFERMWNAKLTRTE